ncbi:hypothetical protein SAMN04488239_101430 [Ruegeria marina]|uniref:Uncharacterized protein n=1 Tax=Ruegeria marina TaxID=639004 RepID=A0A1G6JT35_9RHOB|nr:hypothetical protein SAMN04488239_101430 [Ruegeria marina]
MAVKMGEGTQMFSSGS